MPWIVHLLLHNSAARRSFVEIKSDIMHVFRVALSGTYEVGFYRNSVGGGQCFVAVFTSPKQSVAMAVCNMLNGGPTDINTTICMLSDFLKAEAAKVYNTKEFV